MSIVQTATAGNCNISHLIVEAVAEAEGVSPIELTPPLYDVIDPEALDQIFAVTPTQARMAGQVTFSYTGYEVTVSGDGYISIDKQKSKQQPRIEHTTD